MKQKPWHLMGKCPFCGRARKMFHLNRRDKQFCSPECAQDYIKENNP